MGLAFVLAGTVRGLSRLGIVVQSRKQLDAREGQQLHDTSVIATSKSLKAGRSNTTGRAGGTSSKLSIMAKFIKFGLALTHLICELFVYSVCLVLQI